jgi:hypothetical protein
MNPEIAGDIFVTIRLALILGFFALCIWRVTR